MNYQPQADPTYTTQSGSGMSYKLTITGAGLAQFTQAAETLGSKAKAEKAYSMALNKTARTVHTQVKRTLADQMGTSQANVIKHGKLAVTKASVGNLSVSINAYGGYLPLKDFRPSQRKKGVSASPWKTRELFDGTFLNVGKKAKSGIGPAQKAAAGGHVFKNTGKLNKKQTELYGYERKNAIKALWGPAVPKEMVKDESAKAFETVSRTRMPIEIERAVKALTKNIVS